MLPAAPGPLAQTDVGALRHLYTHVLVAPSPRDLTQSRLYTTLGESEAQSTALCRDHPRILLLAVAVSGVSWVAMIGEFWLMTAVLGLEMTLPQAVTAMVAARVAILLPLPAGLGALEASQALAMRGLGLSPAAGVSLSLLIRARDVLLGLLGLGLAGLLLGRWAVGRTAESGETADAAIERR